MHLKLLLQEIVKFKIMIVKKNYSRQQQQKVLCCFLFSLAPVIMRGAEFDSAVDQTNELPFLRYNISSLVICHTKLVRAFSSVIEKH